MKEVVLIDAARSPMGRSKGGAYRNQRAEKLSSSVLKALLKRNPNFEAKDVDDVIWGCVQQTLEQGFNVARFIALQAGVPYSVPAQTVNRLCGSSMTAIHSAAAMIMAGQGEAFICGGVEHMGHVPMMHGVDFDPAGSKHYAKASGMMGITAEVLSRQHGISREDQDKFALRSHQRATEAFEQGKLKDEIIALEGHDAKGNLISVKRDEVVRTDASYESLAKLPAVFDPKNGTVTAGNSSAISDGAACVLLASKDYADAHGIKPIAKVKAMATVGLDPAIMGYGPVPAVRKVLKNASMSVDDVDIFELNEAFAAQSLPVLKDLGLLDAVDQKVNLNGGAIALGHPLGCSGARIIGTLAHLMKTQDKNVGLATMCIGFGQGVATILERVH